MAAEGGVAGRGGGGAGRLLRLSQGYVLSAVLRAALELGVFDALAGAPAAPADVAAAIGADRRATKILLDALAAADLVDREGERYRLGALAHGFLVSDQPAYLGETLTVYLNGVLWEAMGRLPDAVRSGAPPDDHVQANDGQHWTAMAMALRSSPGPGPEALAKTLAPWLVGRPSAEILEVGAGNGAYGHTILARYAGARLCSVDRPGVAEVARAEADRMGVADRARVVAGDIFEVALGGPYDLAVVSQVLHLFSAEHACQLLRRVAAVLTDDARIAIHDFVDTGQPPAADPAPHLFSAILLGWTGQGQVHSLASYREMLAACGFGAPAVHHVPGAPTKLLLADRARELT